MALRRRHTLSRNGGARTLSRDGGTRMGRLLSILLYIQWRLPLPPRPPQEACPSSATLSYTGRRQLRRGEREREMGLVRPGAGITHPLTPPPSQPDSEIFTPHACSLGVRNPASSMRRIWPPYKEAGACLPAQPAAQRIQPALRRPTAPS